MYITKEQLERRLNKPSVNIKEKERKVRSDIGAERLTHEDRVVIGVLSNIESNKNVAELVGVSPMTVSFNSRGITSPPLGVDKELRNDINSKIENIGKEKLESNKKIEDQLLTNLAAALGHVANNLDGTDASEASRIAVDMSKILDRVTGDRDNKGSKTAIIINVPPMKDEKSYQTIVV